jgi:hypothetical protein
VKEGQYAVRLLFDGKGGGIPSVVAEGGGYLEMEIIRAAAVEAHAAGRTVSYAGDWWVCTFRGLRADGEYAFWIDSGTEVICVRYAKGDFVGQA